MNKLSTILVLLAMALVSCNNQKQNEEEVIETEVVETPSDEAIDSEYISVGEEIDAEGALTMTEMEERYKNLQVGDTVQVKLRSKVNEVCEKKGCWMKLENGESDDVMVKMKDYAFFVPKDIANREVIVEGKAYVTEMSVEDQQHYAEDGGKSKEEIASITEPKRTFSFMADGALVAQQ